MTSSKTNVIEDLDNDFGFTAYHEDEIVSQVLEQHAPKAQLLYDAITPFLDNLMKDPDKSTIVWPDRAKKVAAFKSKLDKILNS
jgi:hypothetical protein